MALCEESKAWETDAAVAFRNPERKELILLDCENKVILEIGRGVLRHCTVEVDTQPGRAACIVRLIGEGLNTQRDKHCDRQQDTEQIFHFCIPSISISVLLNFYTKSSFHVN